tara:strand:- start:213 stop:482 length:270 start_codon:yes stop_codon:yes gene_type:complete
MITKILGFGDFLVIIAMLFFPFLPLKWILYAAGYLILKGGLFAFSGDVASILDIISGIYIVLFAFGFSLNFFSVIVGIYLGQKFLVSWL